jgi:ribonuclease VapC
MVAMMLGEPDHDLLAAQLQQDEERIWSPIARWETVVNVARVRDYGDSDALERAASDVDYLASQLKIHLAPIAAEESRLAIEAFQKFGKGRHPAQLNMGDCFAYACAKTNQARLLYKGDDFSKTDLA